MNNYYKSLRDYIFIVLLSLVCIYFIERFFTSIIGNFEIYIVRIFKELLIGTYFEIFIVFLVRIFSSFSIYITAFLAGIIITFIFKNSLRLYGLCFAFSFFYGSPVLFSIFYSFFVLFDFVSVFYSFIVFLLIIFSVFLSPIILNKYGKEKKEGCFLTLI